MNFLKKLLKCRHLKSMDI